MKLELDILPLTGWLPSAKRPLVISGPCGAETEEQVMGTARELAKLGRVTIFRSGIWKPRTRPNSFEGVGSIGLTWLKKVKKEFGLLTTVEVANAQHVEEALEHGVDILWIGARTTVNPFSVQEIADALKGVDVPVMVKNPLNPDIQLWIGALERINQAGIKKLVAIHRGFYTGVKTQYRNQPQWEIPIELKSIFPQLPIVCDPSHICGRTDILQQVAQKALDLDMAGLMIESHINPGAALSDAKQQVTPARLGELLNSLTVRTSGSLNPEFTDQLAQLRVLIDEIDEDLLEILAKRMEVIEKIGEYKRDNNVTILQLERWLEILRTRTASGISKGMKKDFIEKICTLLHKESIRRQTEVMNEKRSKKY
ncbi:MAG TPA: chorismate mutase [Bacteroidia bacterium]|jgi:chorismate mutase